MDEREIRAALERHWAASDADDFGSEHEIYRDPFEPGPSRAAWAERLS